MGETSKFINQIIMEILLILSNVLINSSHLQCLFTLSISFFCMNILRVNDESRLYQSNCVDQLFQIKVNSLVKHSHRILKPIPVTGQFAVVNQNQEVFLWILLLFFNRLIGHYIAFMNVSMGAFFCMDNGQKVNQFNVPFQSIVKIIKGPYLGDFPKLFHVESSPVKDLSTVIVHHFIYIRISVWSSILTFKKKQHVIIWN